MPMLITTLFTITKLWKQLRCLTDEWIKKMWYSTYCIYICVHI
jgi:hypothetical protein